MGVEIGQLCIVAVVLPIAWSLRCAYRGAFAAGSLEPSPSAWPSCGWCSGPSTWASASTIFADLYPVADERFIAGDQPGALDLMAAVGSNCTGTPKHGKTSRPAFSALLERIDSHPAVALVFGRHWPTLAQLPTGA